MRPEILNSVFAPLATLQGVGEKTAKLLGKLCGNKVADLLFHLPYAIINRSYCPSLLYAREGAVATVKVKVVEHVANQRKSQPYKVICSDGTDQLILNFFKAYPNSICKYLPVGSERIISGKLERFNGLLQMNHPDYILPLERAAEMPKMEAVYPLTAGISNKMLGKWAHEALLRLPKLPEWQDANFMKQENFVSFNESVFRLHNPQTEADLLPTSIYYKRLAYDEMLSNQLSLAIVRQKVKKVAGLKIKGNEMLRKKILASLPFCLTSAQEKVLQEIYADQAEPFRMLRLLQGDVGSGKTVVAFLAMLNAIECGKQAAIMAPTEILAKQHLETLEPLCDELGLCCKLLTGKTKAKERKEIVENLASGKIDIVIGTHALFTEDVEFASLGLAVIDEQHRFGVHQRLALSNKGKKADVLVMTATPIPRTLLLTAYGDMEYSKIDEMPKGRKPVDTRVMSTAKMEDVILGLKKKLSEGARAYWVCPLVEVSEKSDLAAAEERFATLQKVFGNKVGLIHGKMKEKEKDEVMRRFKLGQIALLVATTVIEVGVNVPEATIMVIEHAERFGLAQLHQLRGRIKRGSAQGICILMYAPRCSAIASERLGIMRQTEDGFLIAEKDLDLRGGGEILGARQSGFLEFKLANLQVHKGLLLTAAKDARLIMEQDSELKTLRGQALRNLLYLFERDEGIKNYKA